MHLQTLALVFSLFALGSSECEVSARPGDYYHDYATFAPYGNDTSDHLSPASAVSQCSRAERVVSLLLSQQSLELVSYNDLQSLWKGYGSIKSITARATTDAAARELTARLGPPQGDSTYPLVLKLIAPPPEDPDSARRIQDEGHLRKMLSYKVEQYFYREIAPKLAADVPVPKCVATAAGNEDNRQQIDSELRGVTATIMTDLRPSYPVARTIKENLNEAQVTSALEWLAKFHGRSWKWLPTDMDAFVAPPLQEAALRRKGGQKGGQGIWLNGGYTYLATRRTEYESLARNKGSEWSKALCRPVHGFRESMAEIVAAVLTPRGRPFESYIHGDVKSDNLLTTESGDRVAFVDFQYVGLGLGVCDLAKLFTSSIPQHVLTGIEMTDQMGSLPRKLTMGHGERQLLEHYWTIVNRFAETSGVEYPWELFVKHWETALVDWCRFQASWGFWGNTEWLQARVRSILDDRKWRVWLLSQNSHVMK